MTLATMLLFLPVVTCETECSSSLACINEGTCRIGAPEFGYSNEIVEDEEDSPDNNSNPNEEENYKKMYCECPAGFTGAHCEIALVTCNNDKDDSTSTTCFNGNPCIHAEDDRGGVYYHCGCDALKTDFSYGFSIHFCSKLATTFCSTYFCSNSGKCNEAANSCICTEGWEGPHCQFPISKHILGDDYSERLTPKIQKSSSGNNSITVGIISTFSVILVIIAAAIVLTKKTRAHRTKKYEAQTRELEIRGFQMSSMNHNHSPYGCCELDAVRIIETPPLT